MKAANLPRTLIGPRAAAEPAAVLERGIDEFGSAHPVPGVGQDYGESRQTREQSGKHGKAQ